MSKTDVDVIAEIETVQGHTVTIAFNEAVSGGYVWEHEPVENVEITSELEAAQSGAIGAPAKRVFSITAAKPGEYLLKFNHKRPHEDKASQQAAVSFKVSP